MAPWIGEEEKQAVRNYLDSGGWLTEFRETRGFEQAIAEYVGSRHASVVTNGTVSLFVALAALGIETGDEVIVPAFSMIASANAVLLAGATPVFVDVDAQTLCLDIEATEAAITSPYEGRHAGQPQRAGARTWTACWRCARDTACPSSRTALNRSVPAGMDVTWARSAGSAVSRSARRKSSPPGREARSSPTTMI
jgi:hypothetical protein